ncbi:MAG TPA: hypothetical protein VFE47_04800 [Tepidisphaeraceae bacterium]|jgi:ribosomal protein L40E|nr:hypothetical protein [Tepidisphaeraceae bacterium]
MLAQIHNFSSADSIRVIAWSFVLIVMLVVGFVAVAKVKQRMRSGEVDKNAAASAGFSLADLRQMHRDGILSDDELEKAKAKIVQAARKSVTGGGAVPAKAGDVVSAPETEVIDLEAVAGLVCPACGNTNPPGAIRCAGCGKTLSG